MEQEERSVLGRRRLAGLLLMALGAVLAGQTAGLLFRVLEGAGGGEALLLGGPVLFGGVVYLGALCAMGIGPGRRAS